MAGRHFCLWRRGEPLFARREDGHCIDYYFFPFHFSYWWSDPEQ